VVWCGVVWCGVVWDGVWQADTFRYAILHKEGGFYADLDVTCSRPIEQWLPHVGHDPETTDLIVGFEVVTERPDWINW
jgi:mannosyltransferase OCH1-like enzyme